jgi:hypothetical protein
MKQETFFDIPGYYGLYQISSYGRVISLKFNKFKELKEITYKNFNYPTEVALTKLKKTKRYRIDELVLRSFVCLMPLDFKVIHLNENKKDNRLDNLCWVHRSYLRAEERNKKYKITSFDRQFMQDNKFKITVKDLSVMFNVGISCIYKNIGGL